MAASLEIQIEQISHNVLNLTTTVRATIYCVSTGGTFNNNQCGGAIHFRTSSGEESGAIGFSSSFAANTKTQIFQYTYTVGHKDDGTGNVGVQAEFYTGTGAGTIRGYNSIMLETLGVASTPRIGSTGTPRIGGQVNIRTNRNVTSLRHRITATAYEDGVTPGAGGVYNLGTIADNVTDVYTWTIPTSLMSYMPNQTYINVNISLATYDGSTSSGTYLGSRDVEFQAYMDDDVPVFTSSSVTDSEGFLSQYGAFVQNMSVITVNATATPTTGATIEKYETSLGALYASGATTPLELGKPAEAGSFDVRIRATDTRGRTIVGTRAITVAEYSYPEITVYASRVNSSNIEYDEGTTIRVRVTGSVTNVNNRNTNTGNVVVRYKASTASSWTTASTGSRGQTFDFHTNITGTSATTIYDLQVTCTDSLGASVTREFQVGTYKPILDFKAGGHGVGILSMADIEDGIKIGEDLYLEADDYNSSRAGVGIYAYTRDEDPVEAMRITSQSGSSDVRVNGNLNVGTILSGPMQGAGGEVTAGVYSTRSGQWNLPAIEADGSTTIFGNTSGRVNLNWNYLLGGMVGVTLWEGTWNSGSITATNASKYRIFLMCTNSSTDETIICVRSENQNRLFAFGACAYQDNYLSINAGTFTISGNTITRSMPRGWVLHGTEISGANIVMYIYKVVGII